MTKKTDYGIRYFCECGKVYANKFLSGSKNGIPKNCKSCGKPRGEMIKARCKWMSMAKKSNPLTWWSGTWSIDSIGWAEPKNAYYRLSQIKKMRLVRIDSDNLSVSDSMIDDRMQEP